MQHIMQSSISYNHVSARKCGDFDHASDVRWIKCPEIARLPAQLTSTCIAKCEPYVTVLHLQKKSSFLAHYLLARWVKSTSLMDFAPGATKDALTWRREYMHQVLQDRKAANSRMPHTRYGYPSSAGVHAQNGFCTLRQSEQGAFLMYSSSRRCYRNCISWSYMHRVPCPPRCACARLEVQLTRNFHSVHFINTILSCEASQQPLQGSLYVHTLYARRNISL